MSPPQLMVRRANLDDLAVLRGLWQLECLPVYELEKRLTEFHVVLRADGVVTGTLGIAVSGPHALLHSPAFASLAQQAEGMPPLWEHMLTLARSQGVARLWLRGKVATYWQEAGFAAATPAVLKKLPGVWRGLDGVWWTLPLREEAVHEAAIEKEFAALHAAQQEESERLRRQAAFWKALAWCIAGLFFLGATGLLFWLVRRTPQQSER